MKTKESLVTVSEILIAHRPGLRTVEYRIPNQSFTHLVGQQASMVEIGVPVVELLTEDSTPDNRKVDPNAEEAFAEALDRLFAEDKEFYTALRANWNLPMMHWKRR